MGTMQSSGLVVCLTFAVGCSSSTDCGPKKSTPLPITMDVVDACPGLLTATSADAVKRVIHSSYLMRDEGQAVGVAAMGKALEAAYKSGPAVREMAGTPCVVTGQVGRGERAAENRLTADSSKAGPLRPDEVGLGVSLSEKEGRAAFDCVSTRVGSTAEVPLRITSVFTNRFHKVRKDDRPQDHYVMVAHSAGVAVARELGCAKNGGLPADSGELPPPTQPGSLP